jgi:Lon protease-like protein
MDILTRGTRPFRLVVAHDDLPYPSGTVEWLDDKPEQPDDATAEAAHDAYAMAATVDFGLEAKQGLLSLRSENARLRLVTRLLRAALKRLDFIERAQARARSNGKVRFG